MTLILPLSSLSLPMFPNTVALFTPTSLLDEAKLINRCNMPMTWNAEAEARLPLGILAQVKGARLDYKVLAAHMGPGMALLLKTTNYLTDPRTECSVGVLHQHISKLRRDAGIPASSPRKSKRPASTETPISQAKIPYCFFDNDYEDRGRLGQRCQADSQRRRRKEEAGEGKGGLIC
ncbi:hypothetical protein BDW66DRAFT_127919 [Aspergillus desertorum]